MKLSKEKIKNSLWGAIIGAVFAIIIGFGWGGWVLGSTSQKNADTMVADALIARLVPMCIEIFNDDAQKEKKFRELSEKSYWERDAYVKEQGWATMPYENEPDSMVAEVCAEQIMKGQ
jgi:hypothetical protein